MSRIQSMFRRDREVMVTEDSAGMVRVRIGEPAETILHTRISRLPLDADSQYNVISALGAIESAPAVQSVMGKLKIHVADRVANYQVLPPRAELPHLPTEIVDATLDQALDMVARTWQGIVFFGACDPPATYEVFFVDSPYFAGKRL